MNYELITTYIHDYAIKIQMNSNFFWHFYILVFFWYFSFCNLKNYKSLKLRILKTNRYRHYVDNE